MFLAGTIDYSQTRSLRHKLDSVDTVFVTDPFLRNTYVVSATVPSKLLVLNVGRSSPEGMSVVQENVITLPSGPVKNLWNLVVWEGSGPADSPTWLLGMTSNNLATIIVRLNQNASASIMGNFSIGAPVRNIAVFGGGLYFFLTSSASGRALVAFNPNSSTLDQWADPAFSALYSISFDQSSGLLIGTFVFGSYATWLRTIDWAERIITETSDFLDVVPAGKLSPYDASGSPGARTVVVRLQSGLGLVSRDTEATLNLLNLGKMTLTSLAVPGLAGFVLFRNVTPQILSIMPATLRMASPSHVTVIGSSFGLKDYTVNGSVTTQSAVSPAQVRWLSDSSVALQTPPSHETHPGIARLTVKFVHGPASAIASYVQSWANLSPTTAPASGGSAITIFGAGFSAGDRFVCNWTSLLNISTQTSGLAVSESAVACKSPSWYYRGWCVGFACNSLLWPNLVRAAYDGLVVIPHPEDSIPMLLISPGPPSVLVILQGQTQKIRASAQFDVPFVVAVQDSHGNNCDQGPEYTIQMSLVSCPSNVSVNLGQESTNKSVLIASALRLHRSASGCRLEFFAAGIGLLVYSNVLNVTEGVAAELLIQNLSSPIFGGTPFQAALWVVDSDGNTVHDSINISVYASIIGDPGTVSPLSGTLTVRTYSGMGKFTDLLLNESGTNYSLTFFSLAPALQTTSKIFSVQVGIPAFVKVNWTSGNVLTSMEPIYPAPLAWAVDAGGNPTVNELWFQVELRFQSSLQLPLYKNISVKNSLWGKTSIQATAGIAEFTNLAVSQKLSGYFLVFSVVGVSSAETPLFTVLPGAPASLYVLSQPSGGTSALVLRSQPKLLVRDDGNNTVDVRSWVNVSISGHPPMHIRGHSSVLAESGIAQFTGMQRISFKSLDCFYLSFAKSNVFHC